MVLQDFANALVTETVPSSKLALLWISRESTVMTPGQSTSVVGVTSDCSNAAVAVTILKVEPGG